MRVPDCSLVDGERVGGFTSTDTVNIGASHCSPLGSRTGPANKALSTKKGKKRRRVDCSGRMIKIVQIFPFSPPALQAPPQTSIVQQRNGTAGAAMSLLKKCDANNRLSARRNQRRPSLRPMGQAERANPSEVDPDGPGASRLTFVHDFILEHSLRGLQITLFEISGSF